jgi:hypothetical protein
MPSKIDMRRMSLAMCALPLAAALPIIAAPAAHADNSISQLSCDQLKVVAYLSHKAIAANDADVRRLSKDVEVSISYTTSKIKTVAISKAVAKDLDIAIRAKKQATDTAQAALRRLGALGCKFTEAEIGLR